MKIRACWYGLGGCVFKSVGMNNRSNLPLTRIQGGKTLFTDDLCESLHHALRMTQIGLVKDSFFYFFHRKK